MCTCEGWGHWHTSAYGSPGELGQQKSPTLEPNLLLLLLL